MDELGQVNRSYLKNMQVNTLSDKSLLAAIIFFFSPLLFVLYFIIASLAKINIAENSAFLLLSIITVFGMILLWAAGIVKCVSKISHYYSVTAQVGLFIFLITPFIWGIVGMITMSSLFVSIAGKIFSFLY